MAKLDFTRRDFLRTAASAGAGLVLSGAVLGQATSTSKPNEVMSVGIIGLGMQGRALLVNCLKIPDIRVTALCDIWPYQQKYCANILGKYDQQANLYSDYRRLLEQEKNLQAVIIATPDFAHAEQACAAMESGRHVYCESMMADTLENARKMVLSARNSRKLLQVAHQRRSNVRYQHAIKIIEKDRLLGRLTNCFGQWNRPRRDDAAVGAPKGEALDDAVLKQYGYASMEEFRNWRAFSKYSAGPMAELASHQIDVFNWFLKGTPVSVIATGGCDYYKDRQWFDNIQAVYEYKTGEGVVRTVYQLLSSTSYGGFYESFMGDEGALELSEDARKGFIFREVFAKRREWENDAKKVETLGREAIQLKIGETLTPEGIKDPKAQALALEATKPVHQLHLENFFGAIWRGTPITSGPDTAYAAAVVAIKTNQVIAEGKKVTFAADDFKV